MTIEAAIIKRLGDFAGLSALIGNVSGSGKRVYAGMAPHNAPRPYLVYTTIGRDPYRDQQGVNTVIEKSFQVDCYADTYADAIGLSLQVTAALEDFRGTLSDGSVNWNVRRIRQDGELDLTEAAQAGKEKSPFRRSLDFTIWHRKV